MRLSIDRSLRISFLVLASIACGRVRADTRLLVCGPYTAPGGLTYNEIHAYDVNGAIPQTPEVFAAFGSPPVTMNLGPDGLLYVAEDAADMIHKLSPVTGAVLGSIPVNFPDNENSTPGLVVLPNGNILVGWETNGGVNYRIVEFESNGTELGNWLPLSTPGINVVRFLTLTPFGTVAFLNLHPNNGPNEIREYDATGSFLRIVIPVSEALRMYAFEFSSPAEILLSDLASNKIKRYNWASGSFVSDFANGPEPANNALWVTLDSRNGSVYGASHLNRCVYGWNAGGAPLYGGQPLACYNSGTVLYPGRMLVFTDAPIPAASEWGLAVTVLLIVTAGMIVFCKWHVPRMRGHALT